MPRRQAGSTGQALAMDSTIAVGGGLSAVLGTIVGIASNNLALAGISLCIGAGGLLGWLLAGSPAFHKGNGQ